jgi:SRSO17 transposase
MGWIFTIQAARKERFRTYAADLASVLGHADRVRPFGDYCVGLLSTEGRKSVEPLAAPPRRNEQRRNTNRCYTLWLRHPGPIRRP